MMSPQAESLDPASSRTVEAVHPSALGEAGANLRYLQSLVKIINLADRGNLGEFVIT
jgi:hypothetical protein